MRDHIQIPTADRANAEFTKAELETLGLEENVGATEVTLTADDLARIHGILLEGAAGARYAKGSTSVWN